MANKPQAFKNCDVQKAMKAARSGGLEPHTVEVQTPNGTIIRVIGNKGGSAEATNPSETTNPWDTHDDQR